MHEEKHNKPETDPDGFDNQPKRDHAPEKQGKQAKQGDHMGVVSGGTQTETQNGRQGVRDDRRSGTDNNR